MTHSDVPSGNQQSSWPCHDSDHSLQMIFNNGSNNMMTVGHKNIVCNDRIIAFELQAEPVTILLVQLYMPISKYQHVSTTVHANTKVSTCQYNCTCQYQSINMSVQLYMPIPKYQHVSTTVHANIKVST
jgi:hypothetical protein